jgi:Bacterial membrane protein YfhO
LALALYLVATIATCVLLRRLVETRAALVLVALPLVFTAPAMFTGRTYAPLDLLYTAEPFKSLETVEVRNSILTDVSHQIVPWNLAVRDSIRAGEWPLWNRLMLSGDVLAAAGQPAPYYPVTILGWLLPLAHALTFAAAMGYFVAGLGAYLFFRRIGLGEPASLFGAAAWMYATPVVFYLEWPLGASLALLPLVLFGAEWLLADAMPGAIALTVALTLLILAGHPESVLHVVGAAAAYTLVRMIMLRNFAPRTIVAGLLAGIGALAITAIYLLPVQDALPQTVQYTFRREVFARMDRSVPWPEAGALALRTFVPFAYGRLVHDVADDAPMRYWISDNGYAGSVVLALAILALIRSRRREKWLFLGLAIFGLLAGSDAPVVSDLLALLPLFKIALNERLIMLCAFGLVALAALAIDVIPSVSEGPGRVAGARHEPARPARSLAHARDDRWIFLATFAVLALAVAALWPSMRAGNLQPDLIAKNAAFLLVPLLILPFVRTRTALLILLLVAQRWFEIGDFWPTVDPKLATPRIAQLPQGLYRVVGQGSVLPPNGSAYLGLEDVRGYQAMNLTFFHETYGLWSQAPPVGANLVSDLDAPFLDLMGVRFAFTEPDAPLPAGWRPFARQGGYAIAENTHALPRAFMPGTVICGVDALQAMTRETDFAARGWLRGDCEATPFTNGTGTVRTTRRTPARLTIDVRASAPSWVFVTESAWRGWKARDASGNAVPLRRANHAFLAFQVPAGESRVELSYRPRSFMLGALISAIAVALFAAVCIIRIGRWRASSRSSSSSP